MDLLQRFESATLSKEEWTHEAHVRVALEYVKALPHPKALDKMRSGIERLNAAHGVPQTDTGGYHETLTRVWLRMVRMAWERWGAWDPLWDWLQDKRAVLRFYSRDCMMSREARYGWVEPDIAPLEWQPHEL